LQVSSVLSWRAVTLARNANHFPVISDLLAPHRDPSFVHKERGLVEKLRDIDPEHGFDGLPEPVWRDAFEVCHQYHMLGYVLDRQVTEGRMIVEQVRHGAIRTWYAAEPFIRAERRIRGGEYSFMNSFERFVREAERVDVGVPDRHVTGRRRRSRYRVGRG
jgi:hypothetical protein